MNDSLLQMNTFFPNKLTAIESSIGVNLIAACSQAAILQGPMTES